MRNFAKHFVAHKPDLISLIYFYSFMVIGMGLYLIAHFISIQFPAVAELLRLEAALIWGLALTYRICLFFGK